MIVRDATKQACFFLRIGAVSAGRHFARILKGVRGHGVPGAVGRRGFLLHSTSGIPVPVFIAGSANQLF